MLTTHNNLYYENCEEFCDALVIFEEYNLVFQMKYFYSLINANDLKNFDDTKIGVLASSIFSVIAGGLVDKAKNEGESD